MFYTVAQAHDPQSLVDLVNGLIQKGYEPYGNLCVLGQVGPLAEYCIYVQAMIKRPPEQRAEGSSD